MRVSIDTCFYVAYNNNNGALMKHKNKKRHDELVYAYYEQLMKNETLERKIDMYEEFVTNVKSAVAEMEEAISIVDKA